MSPTLREFLVGMGLIAGVLLLALLLGPSEGEPLTRGTVP